MSDLPIVAPGYAPEPELPETEALSGVLCNVCILNKAVLTETIGVAMNRPFFRVLRILEPLLMLFSLGLGIWAFREGRMELVIRCGFLLAMLVFFYLQQLVIYPRKAVKNQLRRQAMDDGAAELENRLWFTEENVANRRGESDELRHMDYQKIKRVSETERLIVISTRSRSLIPLDKSGFENGGPEELYRLLRRKAPQARIEATRRRGSR